MLGTISRASSSRPYAHSRMRENGRSLQRSESVLATRGHKLHSPHARAMEEGIAEEEGNPGLRSPFPGRPKGMHDRTYQRLRAEMRNAEMEAKAEREIMLGRLLQREENRMERARSAGHVPVDQIGSGMRFRQNSDKWPVSGRNDRGARRVGKRDYRALGLGAARQARVGRVSPR